MPQRYTPQTPNWLTNGLIAYYPFNGNANDASGNGYNGTAHNAATVPDHLLNPDSAYRLNGSDAYVYFGPVASFLLTVLLTFWPSHTEPRGERVRLYVEDNGSGIPGTAQDKIFEVFERLHSSSQYEGSGIGLSIVRKAVLRMEGEVGVESELGRGSRFWIELPRPSS